MDFDGIQEPDGIKRAREIAAMILEKIDAGDLQEMSCYISCSDGRYMIIQTANTDRHTEAGRLFEAAINRLGYTQVEDVREVIESER